MLHSEREEKEMLAVAKYEALAEHAQNLRLAAENARKIKQNAQRLHDYEMKRLEAGDKRNRRKSGFRAACRTYEAVIELLEAQRKCEWRPDGVIEPQRETLGQAALGALYRRLVQRPTLNVVVVQCNEVSSGRAPTKIKSRGVAHES